MEEERMEEPWLPAHLNHTLLNLLSSPQIKLVGEQLRISNHLDMIRDSLWAINAVITDANRRANKESKLKEWLHDVNAAIASIKDILKCLQEEQKQEVAPPPPPNLLHLCQISSTCIISLSSPRHAILIKLKQITQSLNCLLSRANAFDLKIETMDSMDPNQDEYYSILEQTVPERYEDVKKVLKIIFRIGGGQPLWELNEDVPFVTIITGKAWTDKSILARMVYLHPLAREFFKHRIWVDVFNCASVSFDPMHIATECAKQLTGKVSSDDAESWRLIRSSLPEKRFLLILDRINEITMEDKEKWEELKKNLLSSSAPGSRVIITCHFCNIEETEQQEAAEEADQMVKRYDKIYRLDKIWDDEEKRKRYPWDDEEKRKRYPRDDEKEENDDDEKKEKDNISGDGDEKEEEDNISDDEKEENDDDEKEENDNISGDGDEKEEEDNISDDKEKEDNASNDEKEKKNISDDKKEEKDNISDDEKKGKDNISDEGEGPNDSGDD